MPLAPILNQETRWTTSIIKIIKKIINVFANTNPSGYNVSSKINPTGYKVYSNINPSGINVRLP